MIKLEKNQDIYLEELSWERYKDSLKRNKYIRRNYFVKEVSSDFLVLRANPKNNIDTSYFYIEFRCASEKHVKINYKLYKIHSSGPFFLYAVSLVSLLDLIFNWFDFTTTIMNILLIIAPILMALHVPSYFSERVKSLSLIFAQIGKQSTAKRYVMPTQLQSVIRNMSKTKKKSE